MCGIAGCLSLDADRPAPGLDVLTRMAASLHHRGPDEQGVWRDRRVGLAHARLSIIDLSTGQQPMSTADDQAVVCFNGEIFNYVELREELERLGRPFRTRSDTEVLLQAWLADAGTGDLLMCHPALSSPAGDPIGRQRTREFAVLSDNRFPIWIEANGLTVSRLLSV